MNRRSRCVPVVVALVATLALVGGRATPAAAQRFVDNGDGTVTDRQTGLMWEQKTDDGSVHDKDNTYAWSDLGDGDYTDPDGPAFTVFLDELNNCVGSGGSPITGGFAGYCDWRLPTHVELQTILDLTQGSCGGELGACIDPIFGPTAAVNYWSSTTFTDFPYHAWFVYFVNGGVERYDKLNEYCVRAVRGGW